ncbi:MAG: 3-deoxy-D-manno-octulosonic acid transferase [Pseudomonadota bacterium]
MERLCKECPEAHFLVTTGTITSAKLMAERLPQRAIHQYAPIDQPAFIKSFFTHWQPTIGLFVESELWPVLIDSAQKRDIPLALINGRLSPKSSARWAKRAKSAKALFDGFEILMAQDKDNQSRIAALAGRSVHMVGNLKRAAPPLPSDDKALAEMTNALGDRPVWLAASTHSGEEELVIDAHDQLTPQIDDLLTIIAPRHPKRGSAVAELAISRGYKVAQRSLGEAPTPDTDIYIADTLGELGVFYRVSDVAFIGGSLCPVGGHNPMEPARLESAIVTGPHVFNFQETFQAMRRAGGLALVRNERDLSASLLRLLNDPMTREEMAINAKKWADEGAAQVLDDTVEVIRPLLPKNETAPC